MKAILLSLLAGLAAPTAALHAQSPTTFVVTTAADGSDASPGDGTCDDGSGDCTLRAAVDEANATRGEVVIVLPGRLPGGNTGAYTLSAVAPNTAFDTYEDDNAFGDLDLNGRFTSLLIQGTGTPGPKLSISPNDRILDIGDRKTVRIERVWLTGGTARKGRNGSSDGSGVGVDAEDGADGGGIRIGRSAEVTLDQVTISGCFTQSGGNGATPASSIGRTRGGDAGDGGDGGAIYVGTRSELTALRTTITGNGTGDAGGAGSGQSDGSPAAGGAGGDAGNGGGIYNDGFVRLVNCTVFNNTAGDAGAGGAGVNGGENGPVGAGGKGGNVANAQRVRGRLRGQGRAELISTIVAGGQAGNSQNTGAFAGDDLFDASGGRSFSGRSNLIGSDSGVERLRLRGSRIGSADSPIDPVITGQNQNSDWAVPALVLGSGSPAIDAGRSLTSPDYDGRGFVVPAGGGPDIGAYEADSERIPQEIAIEDFSAAGTDGEFVSVTNTGDYALQLDDHALVTFGPDGTACLTANFYGELAPGDSFTYGETEDADQTFDLGVSQDACGSGDDDQFPDSDGAIALYFGRAPNLAGIEIDTKLEQRRDQVTYGGQGDRLTLSDVSAVTVAVGPNPFTDRLRVSVSAAAIDRPTTVTVYDVTGRVVARVADFGLVIDVDLGGLARGAYTARVEHATGVETVAVQKQ